MLNIETFLLLVPIKQISPKDFWILIFNSTSLNWMIKKKKKKMDSGPNGWWGSQIEDIKMPTFAKRTSFLTCIKKLKLFWENLVTPYLKGTPRIKKHLICSIFISHPGLNLIQWEDVSNNLMLHPFASSPNVTVLERKNHQCIKKTFSNYKL